MVPGRGADLRGARGNLKPSRRPFVVFNPASGRGRGAGKIEAYRSLLDRYLPGYASGLTREAGDEYRLTEQALADGHDLIVAVGGDGTWSHVADQILLSAAGSAKASGPAAEDDSGQASEPRDVAFAMLPSGTGNDFGRNLGLSFRDQESAVRAIAEGAERRVDVGRVVTPCVADLEPDSAARPRHFLNLIGLGFDIAVIDAAASARFLRGELLYKLTALQQLFRFPGIPVRIEDGEDWRRSGDHLMVTISNGRYFGGGFPIAPDATIEDGRLHACLIRDASPLGRMKLFGLAEKGRHVSDARVEVRPGARFLLDFDAPVRFEVDGDVYRTIGPRLEVEVLPRALTVAGL